MTRVCLATGEDVDVAALSPKEINRLFSEKVIPYLQLLPSSTPAGDHGDASPAETVPNVASETSRAEAPKAAKKPRGALSTSEARREYQHQYYQDNKEKAKEYQRQYNLTHRKKACVGRGKSGVTQTREVVRTTFNTQDIQDSPMGKTFKILDQIIKGKRLFTM